MEPLGKRKHHMSAQAGTPAEPLPFLLAGKDGRNKLPATHINDARHWRDRAAEMRALADWMKDVDAAAMMLRLADDYDHLADRANKHANGERPQTAQYGHRLCRFVIASCVRHFCVFKLYGLVEVV